MRIKEREKGERINSCRIMNLTIWIKTTFDYWPHLPMCLLTSKLSKVKEALPNTHLCLLARLFSQDQVHLAQNHQGSIHLSI